MSDDSGANHVKVDVSQAIPKVLVVFNHGAVETLSPERAGAGFTFVVKVGKFSLQLLHEAADVSSPHARSKQVNMIAGNAEVEQGNPVSAHILP